MSGYPRPGCTRTASRSCVACSRTRTTTARSLLAPTRLYLDDVRRLRRTRARLRPRDGRRDRGQPEPGRPRRCLAPELDWEAWERQPVFHWLARHVAEDELRRVFNLGIGYCAVVPEAEPEDLVIGRIVAA